MAISETEAADLISLLHSEDWQVVLRGVYAADAWLRTKPPGDSQSSVLVLALVRLAEHRKWEVRRAVANVAGRMVHPSFEPALARFVADDNALVQEAGRRAALRRRDWQNASAFGEQHEQRINATLDGIEARFGVRGREAVKRASQQIADTFARELYHEVVKLMAPIANSAERLKTRLLNAAVPREELSEDADTIGRRVTHLKAVLDAMRVYNARPALEFSEERLQEVVSEALGLVREGTEGAPLPAGGVGSAVVAEICRPRLVQALTNLLVNAIEAYQGIGDRRPLCVTVEDGEGWATIIVEDFGCGMSDEVLADAPVLFATSKPNGTGFGLPLAMKIVESEHAGRVKIHSEKGRGTSVRLDFPKHRASEAV